MAHNKNLKFTEDRLYERLVDTTGWTYHVNGSYYTVQGPCPQCGAEGQKGTAPRSAPLPSTKDGVAGVRPLERPTSSVSVDVAVACSCDSAHGQSNGERGCGARFFVRTGDL